MKKYDYHSVRISRTSKDRLRKLCEFLGKNYKDTIEIALIELEKKTLMDMAQYVLMVSKNEEQ